MRVQRRSILVHFEVSRKISMPELERCTSGPNSHVAVAEQIQNEKSQKNEISSVSCWHSFSVYLLHPAPGCIVANIKRVLGSHGKSLFLPAKILTVFPLSSFVCSLERWWSFLLGKRTRDGMRHRFGVPTPIRVLFYRVRTQPPSNLIKNDFIRGLTVVNWCINWQLPGSREEDEDLIVR